MSTPSPHSADNFAERLRIWRISQNFTQVEAAHQLDIDRSYLSQVERGRTPGTALRTRFLLIERTSTTKVRGGAARSERLRHLPVLSWSQAAQALDPHRLPSSDDEVVPSDVSDEQAFAVRLRGDSMEPRFSDGDIAILVPGVAPTHGDIVVANLKNHGVFCKIIHVQGDRNLLKLSSYNPAYPPMEYHRDDFHWIYPVTSIIRHVRRR